MTSNDFRNKYLTKDENKEIDNFEKLYNINFFETEEKELATLIEQNRGEMLSSELSLLTFESEIEMLELHHLYQIYKKGQDCHVKKEITNKDYITFKSLRNEDDRVFLAKLELLDIKLHKTPKEQIQSKQVSSEKAKYLLKSKDKSFSMKTLDKLYRISNDYVNFLKKNVIYQEEPRDMTKKSTIEFVDLS